MTHNPLGNRIEYQDADGRNQITIAQHTQEIVSHRGIGGVIRSKKDIPHSQVETIDTECTGKKGNCQVKTDVA